MSKPVEVLVFKNGRKTIQPPITFYFKTNRKNYYSIILPEFHRLHLSGSKIS